MRKASVSAAIIPPPKLNSVVALIKSCQDVTLRVGSRAGLTGQLPAPRYRTFADACRALRTDKTYQWFRQCLPKLMSEIPPYPPVAEFEFVERLSTHVMFVLMQRDGSSSGVRVDKRRAALRSAVRSLTKRLFQVSGSSLLTPDTQNQLLDALDRARGELEMRQRRTRSLSYPELQKFAQHFLRHCAISRRYDLLLEFADAMGLKCDETTAARYLKSARTGK